MAEGSGAGLLGPDDFGVVSTRGAGLDEDEGSSGGLGPDLGGGGAAGAAAALAPPPGGDFGSDRIGVLHLDRLLGGSRTRIMHARPEEGAGGEAAGGDAAGGPEGEGGAEGSAGPADRSAAPDLPGPSGQQAQHPPQQQPGAGDDQGGGAQQQGLPPDAGGGAAAPGGSPASGAGAGAGPRRPRYHHHHRQQQRDEGQRQQQHPQQEQQQGQGQGQHPAAGSARAPARGPRTPAGPSAPRPHPFHLKLRHVKTNYKCPTGDGWRLHLVRTQRLQDTQNPTGPSRNHPVILCPGLGSSGAYCFDLSPAVSLADYLAARGWDVWTVELRGNGQSDKPSLMAGRSRWWTIDTHVEKDVPALLRFVLHETKAPQAHFLGHSMGGMVLCGVMARVDTNTSKIRSCIALGSGLFLEDSWWRMFSRLLPLSRFMWTVPSGTLLRNYSRFMLGPYRIPFIDMLYFYPSNVEPRVARMLMSRNFSDISVGVISQIATAFGPRGLTSTDGRVTYAEPSRLGRVTAPTLFMVGDTDRMCPPGGARKTWEMFGSRDKRFVCMGPSSGFDSHYGHFDPLVGKKAATEVFPVIAEFLEHHDTRTPVAKL